MKYGNGDNTKKRTRKVAGKLVGRSVLTKEPADPSSGSSKVRWAEICRSNTASFIP